MTECVCGICPPCRRELRLAARTIAKPVTLSPLAQAILDEPIGYEPVKPRVRPVQNRRARVYVSKAKPPPPPTPCAECGKVRAIVTRSGGNYTSHTIAGTGDLCEVCAERPRYQADIDAYDNAPTPEARKALRRRASKARHYIARELRDGRAYSLLTTTHGNTTGYDAYGCRCTACVTWKADDNATRKAAA